MTSYSVAFDECEKQLISNKKYKTRFFMIKLTLLSSHITLPVIAGASSLQNWYKGLTIPQMANRGKSWGLVRYN